jgi:ATP-dependent DNA ligase
MGCKKIKSTDELEKILRDDNYIGQEKIDGVRGTIHVLHDGSLRFTTRGATLEDPDTPIDITHRLPHLTKYKIKALGGAILDSELYDPSRTSAEVAGIVNYKSTVPVPETIQPRIFDIPQDWRGNNLENTILSKRLKILGQVEVALMYKLDMFHFVPYVEGYETKNAMLNDLLSRGFEGMVFKNLYSTYHQDKKKAGTWYKYKKKDTIDVKITGAKPPEKFYRDPETGQYDLSRLTKPYSKGWLGSIEFAFELKGHTYKGYCSGISDEIREKLSDGHHSIKLDYIGRVMEVEYMEKTSDGNLRHPRFVRIREEIEKKL